jgi:hypothetical protein
MGIRAPWFYSLSALALAGMLPGALQAANQPGGPSSRPVLHWADGRQAVGEIRPSAKPGVLSWQDSSAKSPVGLVWDEVSSIEWPAATTQPKRTGDFSFEMASGDVLFGSLLALDDKQAELDIPHLGRIHVQRSKLHRIDRSTGGGELVYLGPNGLLGWKEPKDQNRWSVDLGRPATDHQVSAIRGDLGLPALASIEFEISWKSKPDFVFALGVDDNQTSVKHAFRVEAWGGDLIVQRELKTNADLCVIAELGRGPGRVHFQAYLDQEQGQIVVFSADGKRLYNLLVAEGRSPALSGLYLINLRGDIRLDRLRIARWNGKIPDEVRAREPRIHRVGGSIIYGQVIRFDAGSNEFHVKTDAGELRVPANQVSTAFFPGPDDPAPRLIRAVFQDGSRISGDLVKVGDGILELNAPGFHEPLRLPLTGLRALLVLRKG